MKQIAHGCFSRSCPKCCVCAQRPKQCFHYYKDSYRIKNLASLPRERITSSKYIILGSCFPSWRYLWHSSAVSRRNTFCADERISDLQSNYNIAGYSKDITITVSPKCLWKPIWDRRIIELQMILRLIQVSVTWKVIASNWWGSGGNHSPGGWCREAGNTRNQRHGGRLVRGLMRSKGLGSHHKYPDRKQLGLGRLLEEGCLQ